MPEFDITLVDGFAGGGMYQDDKPGSPLVMIEAVKTASVNINKDRGKPVNINADYFFIEEDSGNFAALQKHLSGKSFSQMLLKGDFHTYLPEIVAAIKKKHPGGGGGAIFFLDQEGYSKVDMGGIRYIRNELPQAEVILTSAISYLIDFVKDPDKLRNIAQKINLQYLDVGEFAHLRNAVEDHRNILESRWSAAIHATSGFPYYRSFFIEPAGKRRGYLLIHLSPHYRAHNAMTETTWRTSNQVRHYGKAGTRIYDICYKGEATPNLFGELFAEEAMREHIEGLTLDLPPIILQEKNSTVREIIEKSCNDTVATPEMYKKSLGKLKDSGEVEVRGKSGGKKRGGKIQLNDRVSIQRQAYLFLPEDKHDDD